MFMKDPSASALPQAHASAISEETHGGTADRFAETIQLVGQLFQVPIAGLIISAPEPAFLSTRQIGIREAALFSVLCGRIARSGQPLAVENIAQESGYAQIPLVAAQSPIAFFAGAPLLATDNTLLGTLFVADQTARPVTDDKLAILQVIADQIGAHIELKQRTVEHQRLIAERDKAQQALQQREEELKAIVEHAVDGICIVDIDTRLVLKSNAAFREMLGYTESEIQALSLYDMVAHDKSSVDRNLDKIIQANEVIVGERQYLRKDKAVIVVDVSARLISYDGRTAICAIVHDLTEKRMVDSALRSAEASFQSLFENAAEGIFQTTPNGQYLRVNPALARIYGYDSAEQMASELRDISHQLYVETGRRDEFQRLLTVHSSIVGFESLVKRRDGAVIWISESARPVHDDHGQLIYYEGFVQDITDRKALEMQRERSLHEAQLRADRDFLTELWNHRAFHNQADSFLAQAADNSHSVSLVLVDIDNFRLFNDLYGHVVGDEVLRVVARSLRRVCGNDHILARFGSDEFALLRTHPSTVSHEFVEADLALALADLTFQPPGHAMSMPITVSIGAAVGPHTGANRLDLLNAADERLRWAKTGGMGAQRAEQMRNHLCHTIEGFSMLDALVTAVDNKDRYTRRHSEDVMEHCLAIAAHLGLDQSSQQNLAVAALLHDVGKIGVPDSILRKPGNLTDAEYDAIKLHPAMGAAIVAAVPGLQSTLDAVRYHHESYNGTGYPAGLKGQRIPFIARIMAVADAFSAMTTDRPYRKGMDPERALSILQEGAGKNWDPAIVAAFLAARGCPATPHISLKAA